MISVFLLLYTAKYILKDPVPLETFLNIIWFCNFIAIYRSIPGRNPTSQMRSLWSNGLWGQGAITPPLSHPRNN